MIQHRSIDRQPANTNLAAVSKLLSPDGWAYASSLPVEAGDPGRFHALFGRDSLIFALQVLTERPDVATATLRTLAALQGQLDDLEIEEQPGKILHEYRLVAPDWLVKQGWPIRDGGIRYYGTSDATSWFLILLEATGDASLQAELQANWRAAGDWLQQALNDGNGLVRCGPRHFPGGLVQQGWRDSLNPTIDGHGGGIVHEDGSMPSVPMADADSQATAVAGLDALVRLDPKNSQHWSEMASRLRARISNSFSPEVMALDANNETVSGAGSQHGWLLWAGALNESATDQAIQRLTRPDILTDYGMRTLADSHPAFIADGYHRGAIWPFDNWIAWGGLRRYGADEHADRIRVGVRRAIAQLGHYPELYAVRAGQVEAISVANRIQAWTVGAAVAFDADWDGRYR